MKTINQNTKERSIDRILERQNANSLMNFYVPVFKGINAYFTRRYLAKEFAGVIGSEVKSLD